MKKLLLSLSSLALVFAMASCNNPKSAGEKAGKKYCECSKLEDKSGDKNKKAYTKCMLEFRKMDAEYTAKFVVKKADMEKYEKSGNKYIEKKCSKKSDYDDYDDYSSSAIDSVVYEDYDF